VRPRRRLRYTDAHPAGHYYSPIASLESIRARARDIWPDIPASQVPGVDLNEKGQIALLDRLSAFHDEQPFSERRTPDRRYFFANSFYGAADAIVLYCMIRHLAPSRIVEVGSGFSSALMLDTNELHFDDRIELTFIDPTPIRLRELLRRDDTTSRIISEPVQSVELGIFDDLRDGDILFIDSSHVVKIDSDVNRIFFEILPRLARGVHIHIHDVFFPFEYPREYVERGWAWNESYLLHAFLQFNSDFKISFFPTYLHTFHEEVLARKLPLATRTPTKWPTLATANIWLERHDGATRAGRADR
jgi:predicted O-methyltransferase YrrM